MEKINRAKDILQANNIKITPQRIAVYSALWDLGHACAEQIIERVHYSTPTITVATIYNVLDCFVSNKIISMVSTPQNRMCFDITTKDHHHLMDASDNCVKDFDDPKLDELVRDYLKDVTISGFEIENISIQIKGKFIKSN